MTDGLDGWVNDIHVGDAFDVLEHLPTESVDAVVTDPPYGLAFMGRSWDDFEPAEYQDWCEEWATLALDVLKPGGHLLAFSGNRTHHRLFTGVEDAGFEVRDTLTWHYGSGFPKALDVSKAIDKRAGAEREVVGTDERYTNSSDDAKNALGSNHKDSQGFSGDPSTITAPATDAAERWDGWKTTLKPATEFVVLARKPLGEGTVAENVQAHGTGALNIEACRVEGEVKQFENDNGDAETCYSDGLHGSKQVGTTEGRYPSNVVFDAVEADRLDREVGDVDGCPTHTVNDHGDRTVLDGGGLGATGERVEGYSDSGGPSRYFYTSKATRAERTLGGKIANAHPTVKPTDLMEWLVRLATREDQIVLDPFAGSGTTCAAAKDLGRRFVGIEQQAQWADVARVRCGLTPDDPSHVRADDDQTGLDAFADGGGGDD